MTDKETNATQLEEVDRLIKEQGERQITLEGAEGEQCVVSSRIAFQSPMIMEALGDSELNYMQLNRVRGDILKAIVEFMTHHATVEPMHEIPDTLEAGSFDEIVKLEWYRDFINNMTHDFMCEVLSAANYLLIKPLLDIICLFASYQVQGKTAEEIREKFNFPSMGPGEEERARQDLPWIFEED